MAFGDVITYICLAIALWYVPRYLVRVYVPGFGPWLRAWWQRGLDVQRARYEQRAVAYGLRDMSSQSGSEAVPAGSGTGSAAVVLPQQNQENRELVRNLTDVIAFLDRQNLTSDEAAAILSVLRRSDDDYFLSANKIRDVVGGADAAVKAQVAAYRPRKSATPSRGKRLERPMSGW
jgi:hypothetical protein